MTDKEKLAEKENQKNCYKKSKAYKEELLLEKAQSVKKMKLSFQMNSNLMMVLTILSDAKKVKLLNHYLLFYLR